MTESTTLKAYEFLVEMFDLCEHGARAIGVKTVNKHWGYASFLQAIQRLKIVNRSGHWYHWVTKRQPDWYMAERLHSEVLDQVRFKRKKKRQRERLY